MEDKLEKRREALKPVMNSMSQVRRVAIQTEHMSDDTFKEFVDLKCIELMEPMVEAVVVEAFIARKPSVQIRHVSVDRRGTVQEWIKAVMVALSEEGVLGVGKEMVEEYYIRLETARAMEPKSKSEVYPKEK